MMTCTYSPTFNKFNTNCPYFSKGICTGTKSMPCKYIHHKVCNDNFFCDYEDCKFGHSISYTKRIIVNDIYDLKYRKETSAYETSNNRCKRPMLCVYEKCKCDHHLDFKDRKFIYDMANSSVTDEEAIEEFNKTYLSYNEFSEITEDKPKTSLPNSDTLSSAMTVASVSPMLTPTLPVSFVSLFKNDDIEEVKSVKSDNSDNSDKSDKSIEIVEKMSNIVKNININETKSVELKQKIVKKEADITKMQEEITRMQEELAKMQEELAISDSIVSSDQKELKKLSEELIKDI